MSTHKHMPITHPGGHVKTKALQQFHAVHFRYLISPAFYKCFINSWEFLRWCSGKESTCQCRRPKRHRLDPWVRKIPWSRKRQPTPVFLLGKSLGQRSLVGYSPWDYKGVGHNLATKQQYQQQTGLLTVPLHGFRLLYSK